MSDSDKTNVQALSTYLSTAATGAPATTAAALLKTLIPASFNYSGEPTGTTPHYGIQFTQANSGSSTQGKIKPIIFYDASSNPQGIRPSELTTLLIQAVLDMKMAVFPLTVTTAASGLFTQDLTSYGFTNPPNVQLQPTGAAGQGTIANVISKSATSLTIYTSRTQAILLGTTSPVVPVATSVDILLTPV